MINCEAEVLENVRKLQLHATMELEFLNFTTFGTFI